MIVMGSFAEFSKELENVFQLPALSTKLITAYASADDEDTLPLNCQLYVAICELGCGCIRLLCCGGGNLVHQMIWTAECNGVERTAARHVIGGTRTHTHTYTRADVIVG